MTKRPVTLRVVLPLVAALLLLAAALGVRGWLARSAAGPRAAPALRAEMAALPTIDPAELALWRARHAELAARRWSEPALAALQARLGARWQWRSLPAESGTRAYALRAFTPEALAWTAILAALAGIESSPGVTVEEFAIATAGSRTVRHFSRVEIHLRFQWAEAGTGHTVPPESVRRDRVLLGPDFPERGAEGRARAAPLRRTSASAEPPAPARPPLRSRPDHPRRSRLRENLSEPQPT